MGPKREKREPSLGRAYGPCHLPCLCARRRTVRVGKQRIKPCGCGTLKEKKKARSWKGIRVRSLCLTYAPEGGQLASGSQDGTVRLWDTQTGQLLNDLASTCRGYLYTLAFRQIYLLVVGMVSSRLYDINYPTVGHWPGSHGVTAGN